MPIFQGRHAFLHFRLTFQAMTTMIHTAQVQTIISLKGNRSFTSIGSCKAQKLSFPAGTAANLGFQRLIVG
jgi:hypothetical protein